MGRGAKSIAAIPGTKSRWRYPEAPGWIEAQAEGVRTKLAEAGDRPVRVLFSAHGIPEKLVTGKGDLCISFTGDTRPAMWVLDEVTLAR